MNETRVTMSDDHVSQGCRFRILNQEMLEAGMA